VILNTPPQDRVAISKTNLGSQVLSSLSRQGLGEEISKLIVAVYMMNIEQSFLSHIPNKMQVNLNVLHPRVLDGIETELSSTQVVTKQCWWRSKMESKFLK
jgi:hypothetical protein